MKNNKITFWVAIIISIILLVIVVKFDFVSNNRQFLFNVSGNTYQGLLIGILGSCLVVGVFALVNFLNERNDELKKQYYYLAVEYSFILILTDTVSKIKNSNNNQYPYIVYKLNNLNDLIKDEARINPDKLSFYMISNILSFSKRLPLNAIIEDIMVTNTKLDNLFHKQTSLLIDDFFENINAKIPDINGNISVENSTYDKLRLKCTEIIISANVCLQLIDYALMRLEGYVSVATSWEKSKGEIIQDYEKIIRREDTRI